MNDENFYKKAVAQSKPPHSPQNDHQRSGLRFARRVRLPRAVGLGWMFLPIAAVLASQPIAGGWWLFLVGWSFVWPHLAWQLASKAIDPLSREIYNLKADAILAGVWVGVMGVNVLPSTALLMMMCMNLMGAGGLRLFIAGMVLMVVSCLVTLQLTGITVAFRSAPLEWWFSLPVIVIYPLLFAWVSYQTATKLAEHKRRLQVMSMRDGMTGVYNRRHWEILLRNEFDNCRRYHRDATLLIIDIDHFKSINDTWGHDVGDEAIIALTRQLQMTLRGSDVIGRFGGDEFAVIMCGTPADNAIAAMSRVHERLNALRLPCAPQVILRISVGVAPLTTQIGHYREMAEIGGYGAL
ncbi:diguanylate cyclase AdrA [Citrobacter koseri]|uniref:diguanylate cyclase n=1 Tax=Citrobacter koseri TaxID=545 RepID=A0A3S4J6L7_CITKO|nr:diguanylate cyclase AdrA [Citrobacter koseri]